MIDSQIQVIDNAICRHIDSINGSTRGAISQDILTKINSDTDRVSLLLYRKKSVDKGALFVLCDVLENPIGKVQEARFDSSNLYGNIKVVSIPQLVRCKPKINL